MFQITNVQSFAQLGIQIEWKGEAEKEVGIVSAIDNSVIARSEATRQSLSTNLTTGVNSNIPAFQDSNIPSVSVGDTVIAIDPNYYRPTEVDLLIGDPSKANEKLNWQAETKLEKLVEIMVQSDFKKVLEKGY